jgi:hypothetical protein
MKNLSCLLALFMTAGVLAGQNQQPPKTTVQKLSAGWADSARKINALANEFPADMYDYKPTPQVRSFAEQLLHVAFWNQFVEKAARGEKPDPKPNQLPRAEYKTKEQVVSVVKTSFEGAIAALNASSEESALQRLQLWAGFLEHNGEHYGQMVMYYRLKNLVPPESR